jgi:hypothetical protein
MVVGWSFMGKRIHQLKCCDEEVWVSMLTPDFVVGQMRWREEEHMCIS